MEVRKEALKTSDNISYFFRLLYNISYCFRLFEWSLYSITIFYYILYSIMSTANYGHMKRLVRRIIHGQILIKFFF